MLDRFRNLATLESVDAARLEALRTLEIRTIGDLLSFQPFRHARYVGAAMDGLLRRDDVLPYIDRRLHAAEMPMIWRSPTTAIRGIGESQGETLKGLGIHSVADLAAFEPYDEAERLVSPECDEEADPAGPSCVIPRCKKFTRNSKRFVSYFRQEDIRRVRISVHGQARHQMIGRLFDIEPEDARVVHLGYSVSYLQDWIYCGIHLGEPRGCVSLFMAQDSQVSVLDWRRLGRSSYAEDTRISERLASTMVHQRAVDEVARATAEEHQFGGTSAFGANVATAGSLVAAGALIGGVGGGVSGALAGLVLGNAANAAGGAPTLGGLAIGTAVGGLAGAAAGSLIGSGAATLGFVQTDANGDRSVSVTSAQDIQQRTVQNSSSLRSFWSNIISQGVQEESQRIRTERVTNHNRIHALNAIFFELLNEYRVNIRAERAAPILFLPFKPIHFDTDILARYWWIIRGVLTDRQLVARLDRRFLALGSGIDTVEDGTTIPAIGTIMSSRIEVELNLDGSGMREIVRAAVGSAYPATLLAVLVSQFIGMVRRDQVDAELITLEGVVSLRRTERASTNVNFVARFETTQPVAVASIRAVRIKNQNPEFTLPTLRGPIDLNELAFEAVVAKLLVADKATIARAIPGIGSLENEGKISSGMVKVAGFRSHDVPWNAADRLVAIYEGVAGQFAAQTAELADEEMTEILLQRLLSFLNANRFTMTRLILQGIEREQVATVLEGVVVDGTALSSLAGTTPIGFCGNHVVLPLRRGVGSAEPAFTLDLRKLREHLTAVKRADLGKPDGARTMQTFAAFLTAFSRAGEDRDDLSELDIRLIDAVSELLASIAAAAADLASRPPAERIGRARAHADQIRAGMLKMEEILDLGSDSGSANPAASVERIRNYYDEVVEGLAEMMGKVLSSDEVSLPSPAVFMEPVLSRSKGAERYDMRRNSHYDILPAPGIGDADPNAMRSRDDRLAPTVVPASLSVQSPPDYPISNLGQVVTGEAGKLSLETLIQSNASSLGTTLSGLLAQVADMARASASLTGDAQRQIVDAASNVSKSVADVIKQMAVSTPSAPSAATTAKPAEASKVAAPPPPTTPQQKAEAVREAERIDASKAPASAKQERKRTLGIPVVPETRRDYRLAIEFRDIFGNLFRKDDLTIRLSISSFENGTTIPLNGGAPIELLSDGQYLFPDPFGGAPGRRITLTVTADIAGVPFSQSESLVLPDRPDILFRAQVRRTTEKRTSSSSSSALQESVNGSAFKVGLNALLSSSSALGLAAKLFEIVELKSDGSRKSDLNLIGEYNASETTTGSSSSGTGSTREYEVTLPSPGWILTVM
jgi:hypothetical protein